MKTAYIICIMLVCSAYAQVDPCTVQMAATMRNKFVSMINGMYCVYLSDYVVICMYLYIDMKSAHDFADIGNAIMNNSPWSVSC